MANFFDFLNKKNNDNYNISSNNSSFSQNLVRNNTNSFNHNNKDYQNEQNNINNINTDINQSEQSQEHNEVNNQSINDKKENFRPDQIKNSANQANPVNINDKENSDFFSLNLDLITHLTSRSNRVMMTAKNKAVELKNDYIDSEHLLYGLLTDSEIYNLLNELKISPQLIQEELNKIYKRGAISKNPTISPRLKKIINDSLIIARRLGFEFIAPEHLLMSLYNEGEGIGARILVKAGLQKEMLNKKITGKREGLISEEELKAQKRKKALEKFTVDLTAKASQGLLDPVVERSSIIERVVHILSRRKKNNPCLIGEAGVGKTAIVEGLAQKIVNRQVPENLLNKRILELDLMSILAGASYRGEFEERMKDLLEQINLSKGNIILFIDEIHNIVGAGSSGEGSLDASNFLKPALARGELQLIGATTITEYRKYIEKDPALERRLQPVLVPEPTEEQAIKMLIALKDKYEAFHKVKIPNEAIESAVKLSKRYIGDRFLPDKAVDLMDEASSAVRLPLISLPEEIRSLELRIKELTQEKIEANKKRDQLKERILNSKIDELNSQLKEKQEEYNLKKSQTTTTVTVEIIKDIISRWTGIPVSKITSSETEKLANLENFIHKKLINQENAVSAVAQAIRRSRAGLKRPNKPIGSFVFLGPTGVGKTELAKTLADILFGSEETLIRFDMTEYMERHEVAKLLGAPPGYVGYEEGGKLTEAVRRKPYSVVLFDEIEKAHPDIFNILLQILDEGRLTDNKGHVVSFKNTVIICTSNIGSKLIQEELSQNKIKKDNDKNIKKEDKFNDKDTMKTKDEKKTNNNFDLVKDKVMLEILKFFRPELLNRFDELVIFEPLKFKDIMKIVDLQLQIVKKLLEEQEIGFYYENDVIDEIAEIGFDSVYGARPLKRAIQKYIEDPISNLIIEKKVVKGDIIKAKIQNQELVFEIDKSSFAQINNNEKYICLDCGFIFEQEVIKNATIICPKCAKNNLKINSNELSDNFDNLKNDNLNFNQLKNSNGKNFVSSN